MVSLKTCNNETKNKSYVNSNYSNCLLLCFPKSLEIDWFNYQISFYDQLNASCIHCMLKLIFEKQKAKKIIAKTKFFILHEVRIGFINYNCTA